MRAAVIQPYFIPYAGYFRLFAASDLVVMFDCVQFPRRGWVHRNRLPLASGESDWFTLPIAKAPQETVISDLRFPAGARERLSQASHRFPIFELGQRERNTLAERILDLHTDDVTQYLIELVNETATTLGLSRPVVRSSSLPIPAGLHAQERVIAILQHVGATSYVNPSGGRELYDHATFDAAGIELGFLTPYGGAMDSIFTRLLEASSGDLADEIRRETIVAA